MSQSITLSSQSAQILPETTNLGRTVPGSFGKFLLEKGIRPLWWIAGIGIIVQFVVFKMLYPYPDFFSDSYSYLFAAYAHLDVNIWPIGYSKFLLLFHYLTYSSTALTAFQYFFLELGAAYFFFTFMYLFRPNKVSWIIIFLFLFFNPLFLYISNYINSDPLFAALSLFWITQLLWILYKPKVYQLFAQAVLLFVCFTMRNNAYYYPVIGAVAFLLSRQTWKSKVIGILLPIAFILPFIFYTRYAAFQMTGTRQYSLFTGWQLANNALYMRGHVDVDSTLLPNKGTRILNRMTEQYFAHRSAEFDDYLSAYVANFFIRQFDAPLKEFYTKYFHPKDEYENITAWAQASIIFGQYGTYLIKNHPIEFIQYYIWRNIKNYFVPPLEKLEIYNLGEYQVAPIAQYWFHFKSKTVSAISQRGQGAILYLYPLLFCFMNLYFMVNLYFWLTNKRLRKSNSKFSSYILLAVTFWFVNLGFSVIATINVFRYQFVPMILCVAFSLLLTAFSEIKGPNSSKSTNYARK